MFCGKCGAQNSENATFCKECGALINGSGENVPPAIDSVFQWGQGGQRNRKVGIMAVAVAAVAVVILLFSLFGGRGYKSTAEKAINAVLAADAKTLFQLIPDNVIDLALKENGCTRQELDNYLDEFGKDLEILANNYMLGFGDNWKFSCRALGAEDVTPKELRRLKEGYKEECNASISAAKDVEVEVIIRRDDIEDSSTMEIPVVKAGRSWYLDVSRFDYISLF